jgi:tetracenomycin A2 monooxygenase-dioxygenase
VIETDVLIVGAGPTGMALAIALKRFGVRSFVTERNPGTSAHPRSRGCTARTMEIYRIWGVEARVRAGALPAGSDSIWLCEKGIGPVWAFSRPQAPSVLSPTPHSMVTQDVVEEALDAELARSPGVELRRRTELIAFEEADGTVSGTVRDLATAADLQVRARYVVGCDGPGSTVRRSAGIEMIGERSIAETNSYYYRADLSYLPHTRQALAFIVRPDDPSIPPVEIVSSCPESDRWLYIQRREGGQPLFTQAELANVVRAQWGIPDLEVELISTASWSVSTQVAEHFRRGRALLAGDAAHAFPSSGGQGLNSGVGDAHNHAWKLALVLRGAAPDRLLDTYEVERRPVAERNTSWSVGNHHRFARMYAAYDRRHEDLDGLHDALVDFENHMHNEGQAMGYVYARGALVDDGSPLPRDNPRYYWPTDRPGARFPHMWIDRRWSESTIDWFDTAFVLVTAPKAERWRAAGTEVAAARPGMLLVRTLPSLAGPFSFGSEGAVLVRPDGHVAWRPGELSGDLAGALDGALQEVLGGGTEAGEPVSALSRPEPARRRP